MPSTVFANNMEVSCKAAAGKTICAFPDVCMTPPENPATPPGIPVPYPNTGMASDTTDGSKKVSIGGQEVGLKNKSCFKRSMGDEAGCAAKKGVITSTNMGKVYFQMWSMDVKIEGENAVRNLDITTNNHASMPGDTPTWPYIDTAAMSDPDHPCVEDQIKEMEACKEYTPYGAKDACAEAGLMEKSGRSYDVEMAMSSGTAKDNTNALWDADNAAGHECIAARRCSLQPYDSEKTHCCPGQTPHHLVEASAFFKSGEGNGRGGSEKGVPSVPLAGINTGPGGYREGDAPCVCAEGPTQNVGTHGIMHTLQSTRSMGVPDTGSLSYADNSTVSSLRVTTYKDAKVNATDAMETAFPTTTCNPACIEKQLDNYHNQAGITDTTPVQAVTTGNTGGAANEFATRWAQRRGPAR